MFNSISGHRLKKYRLVIAVKLRKSGTALILACLFSSSSFAISLPFFDQGIPFELILNDTATLENRNNLIALINDGIQQQRDNNITLKQYSDPAKIARFEADVIRRILKSQGYFRFFVRSKLIRSNKLTGKDHSSSKRPETEVAIDKIVYQISPGRQYQVNDIEFALDKSIDIDMLSDLAIGLGENLIAEHVLASLDQIRRHVRQSYCFYDVKIDYKVFINHQDASAKLIFQMQPSQQTKFGPFFIKGLESIDYAYIKSFIRYEEGQCFRRDKIAASRLSLLRSNLISNVRINIEDIKEQQVITTYYVDERNHRTLKAGIGYSSDEGPYLTGGWEHRNLRGAGEHLEFRTRISAVRKKILAEYFIPRFFDQDKSLTLYSESIDEDLDSYEALSLKAGVRVGFKHTEYLHFSIGTELKISDVNDQEEQEAFYLLSFPLVAEWDHTNDILNPTDGFLITAKLRPYIDIVNTQTKFYKTLLSFSGYHSFDVALKPTIAARYSIGTITGESVENIPADERFYVGGGGSVRGYAYQSLSRLDGKDPEGGSSFQQINTELRVRFFENWGLATFAGGGFAFNTATSDLNEKLLWAAGFGLRYYTDFAPFRMDIAFPLDKRDSYDDDFQLYVSIGQAF